MNEETVNEINNLMNQFSNPSIEQEVMAAQIEDPNHQLRKEILAFFTDRFQRIQKSERLKEQIQESFEAMIEREELTFDQLITLYSIVAKQNSFAAQGILDIFKPVPGAPSILAPEVVHQEDKDDYEKEYDNLSSEELQAVGALYRAIQQARKDSKNAEDVEVTE